MSKKKSKLDITRYENGDPVMVPGDAPIPTDMEIFTGVLDSLHIPHTIRADNTVILATKYVKFTGDGKRNLTGPQDKRPE